MFACRNITPAKKRYERDVFRLMMGYAVALFGSAWFIKHGHLHGVPAYFFAVLPALPIIGLLARMGRYLGEEKDEYERMLTVRSILIGTGALLGTIVVSDFTRSFAGSDALPPFVCFMVFMAAMGISQFVNWLQNRGREE